MQIESVHHIGIRVTDGPRAIAFYEQFGFRLVYRDGKDPVVVLNTDSGVELNLIINAPALDGKNRLMDGAREVTRLHPRRPARRLDR